MGNEVALVLVVEGSELVSVFSGSDGVMGSVFSAGGAAGSPESGASSVASSSLEQAMASIRVRDNVINQWGFIMSSAYRGGFRRQPFVVNRGFGHDH